MYYSKWLFNSLSTIYTVHGWINRPYAAPLRLKSLTTTSCTLCSPCGRMHEHTSTCAAETRCCRTEPSTHPARSGVYLALKCKHIKTLWAYLKHTGSHLHKVQTMNATRAQRLHIWPVLQKEIRLKKVYRFVSDSRSPRFLIFPSECSPGPGVLGQVYTEVLIIYMLGCYS